MEKKLIIINLVYQLYWIILIEKQIKIINFFIKQIKCQKKEEEEFILLISIFLKEKTSYS